VPPFATYDLGDPVTLTHTFSADPTTVTLEVRRPSGVWSTVAPTKVSPANYSHTFTPDASGVWRWKWTGEGPGADVETGALVVRGDVVETVIVPPTTDLLLDHQSATTGAHGLPDPASLVVTTDARLSDRRVPVLGSVTDAEVAVGAAIAQSKVVGLVDGLAAKLDILDSGDGPVVTGAAGDPKRAQRLAFNSALTAMNRADDKEYTVARMGDVAAIDAGIFDDMIIGDERVKWLTLRAAEGIDFASGDIIDCRYVGNHLASVSTRLVQRRTPGNGGADYTVGIATVDDANVLLDRLMVNNGASSADAFVRVMNGSLRLHATTVDTQRLDADTATIEGTIGQWAAVDANLTVTRSTTSPIAGTASGRIEVVTSASSVRARMSEGLSAVAVPQGGAFCRTSCDVRCDVGPAKGVFLQLMEWDGAGALISAHNSTVFTPAVGATASISTVKTLQIATRFVAFRIVVQNTPAAGQAWAFDNAFLGFDDISSAAADYRFVAGADRTADGVGKLSLKGQIATDVPLAARAIAGQTGNLSEWHDAAGVARALVNPSGVSKWANASGTVLNEVSAGFFRGVGLTNLANTGPYITPNGANMLIIQRTATAPVLVARGAASQSGDLFQVQDSAAAALFVITSAGLPRWNVAGNQQTTVGAAGAAAALPTAPTKYLKVVDSTGATLVIPAYTAA
jgi:hypothetical protein